MTNRPRTPRHRRLIPMCLLSALAVVSLPASAGGEQRTWMLEMPYQGETLEGDAIHWSDSEFFLLKRDGQLQKFPISEAPQAKMVKRQFSSYTQSELRASLQREYGNAYDVSGTGHFLVVHPRGQRDVWASRFEELYREMIHYFNVRGIATHPPKFPLIAIVFPTYEVFAEHAKKEGVSRRSIAGYYSPKHNRILMFDQSNGRLPEWRENAATIVHEAAHQTAFNTGIHSRWAKPPTWICEGLGTLFEAPGVNNAKSYRDLEDRVNRNELQTYLRYFPQGIEEGAIEELVSTNIVFQQRPAAAYALSWAITFYFSERQPSKLAEYLKITSDKDGFFRDVPPEERMRDFRAAFGNDLEMLGIRIDRYIRDRDQ